MGSPEGSTYQFVANFTVHCGDWGLKEGARENKAVECFEMVF
jgi:hypothetical protein